MSMPRSMMVLLRRAKSSALSDGELLIQYIHQQDAQAFRAIVERHGNMVQGVCRRGVRNDADADDLFQAVFLQLARAAARIRQPDALAAWLHSAARRLTLQWQKQQYRTLPITSERSSSDPLADASWQEVRQLLDDELARLPYRLRSPLVLCYLQGLKGSEAADQLGISLRTLRRDLEQGRIELRERLAKRGLAHLTLASALTTTDGVNAFPPSQLIDATVSQWASWQAGLPVTASLQPLLATSGTSLLAPLISLMLLTGITTVLFFWTNQSVTPTPTTAAGIQIAARQPAGPRVDAYGDELPEGILTRLGTIRFRHGSPVYSMTFSKDGQRLFTGSNDGTVRCSEFPSGKVLWSVTMPTVARNGFESVVALALSADNKTLAASAMNDTTHLLDAQTGKILMRLGEANDRSEWLGFSTDGKSLYALTTRRSATVRQYDLATGKTIAQDALEDCYDPAASTHSIHLGTGQFQDRLVLADLKNQLIIYNMLTRKVERRFAQHRAKIEDVLWSEDGTYFLTYDQLKSVRRWDAGSGQEQWSVPSKPTGQWARLGLVGSGENARAIVINEREILIYDATHGKLQQRIAKWLHNYTLAVSRDGKVLAAGGGRGEVSFIELASGKSLATVPVSPFNAELFWSDYSPDSKQLLTAGYADSVMVWDVATGKMIQQVDVKGKARFVDNQRLVAAGWNRGGLSLWKLQPLAQERLFDKTVLNPQTGFWSLDLSPDHQNVMVAGNKDKDKNAPQLSQWNIATGEYKIFDAVKGSPLRVAYSPNGKWVAITDFDKQLTICDAKTGARLHQQVIPGSPGGAIIFSPDSQLLAWSTGNQHLCIMETATFTNKVTIDHRGDALDALAFSADGRSLLWGGQHWPTICVFDPLTGQERTQLKQHLGSITHLRFAPDGHSFASTSHDATTLIWDWHQYHARQHSAAVPLDDEQRELLFKQLLGQDAQRSWKALERLLRSPTESLNWIEKHLVKVSEVQHQQVQQWITELASAKFEVRDQASKQLQTHLERAEPLLKQAIAAKPTAEMTIRLNQLLDEYQRTFHFKDRLGELLDSVDTPEARQLKQALAISKLKMP